MIVSFTLGPLTAGKVSQSWVIKILCVVGSQSGDRRAVGHLTTRTRDLRTVGEGLSWSHRSLARSSSPSANSTGDHGPHHQKRCADEERDDEQCDAERWLVVRPRRVSVRAWLRAMRLIRSCHQH